MIYAIVPAAGQSTRMGQPKLILPLAGRSVLEHVVSSLRAGGVDHVLVVAGPHVPGLPLIAALACARVCLLQDATADMRSDGRTRLRLASRNTPATAGRFLDSCTGRSSDAKPRNSSPADRCGWVIGSIDRRSHSQWPSWTSHVVLLDARVWHSPRCREIRGSTPICAPCFRHIRAAGRRRGDTGRLGYAGRFGATAIEINFATWLMHHAIGWSITANRTAAQAPGAAGARIGTTVRGRRLRVRCVSRGVHFVHNRGVYRRVCTARSRVFHRWPLCRTMCAAADTMVDSCNWSCRRAVAVSGPANPRGKRRRGHNVVSVCGSPGDPDRHVDWRYRPPVQCRT